jgi:hypothetical protein
MTDSLNKKEDTNSTNGVSESSETKTSPLEEIVQEKDYPNEVQKQMEEIVQEKDYPNEVQKKLEEKTRYEVVFFIRYYPSCRPSMEEIMDYFNYYGKVHHVTCPNGKDYAFVFMSSLYTNVEHRRTRTTISQIINEMPTEREKRFHITVASSFRRNHRNQNEKTLVRYGHFHPERSYKRQLQYKKYPPNNLPHRWVRTPYVSHDKDNEHRWVRTPYVSHDKDNEQMWVRKRRGTYNPKNFVNIKE